MWVSEVKMERITQKSASESRIKGKRLGRTKHKSTIKATIRSVPYTKSPPTSKTGMLERIRSVTPLLAWVLV